MSRYTDRLFRKAAFTLTGILCQYPGYSGFVMCFLTVIFMCVLSIECLESVIEFNLLVTRGTNKFHSTIVRSAHTVFMCCVNSDLCHLQHKLIGFITGMKSVYSAVRTGALNEAVCVCATYSIN
jgi:hypothetical protein